MDSAHDLADDADTQLATTLELGSTDAPWANLNGRRAGLGDLLQLGFVAQLCLAARDVEQALVQGCRFSPLWSRRTFRYERVGETIFVRASIDASAASSFDPINAVLTWQRLAAWVAASTIVPEAVHVPAHCRAQLRKLLGCPIYDDADQVLLQFALGDVQRVNPSAEERLYRVLLSHGEQLLSDRNELQTTCARVRQVLERQCHHTGLSAAQLAREFGLSARTLHRRLRAEGTSFRLLLTEFQLEKSRRELACSATSAKQLAFALGFSDPASFHRAFKRWTGSTVRAYRASARQAPVRAVRAEQT